MRKLLSLLFLCLLGFTVSSCSDDDKATNELIDSVIPQHLRLEIQKHMPIYTGSTPPNVEGSYRMSPNEMLYNSDGRRPTGTFADLLVQFIYNEPGSNELSYVMEQTDGKTHEYGNSMLISGDGLNFTVFCRSTGNAIGISYTQGVIISGTMTPELDGIKNMRWCMVMIDKENDPDDTLMKVGVFRIFKDGNEYSEKFDWVG